MKEDTTRPHCLILIDYYYPKIIFFVEFIQRNGCNDLHGGDQAEVSVGAAVEVLDDLDPVFGLGVAVQPAVLQPLRHAVAHQHIQQLQGFHTQSQTHTESPDPSSQFNLQSATGLPVGILAPYLYLDSL